MDISNLFIPYGRHSISEEDVNAVIEVLRSNHLTQGPTVPLFEKTIASLVSAKYSVAVNSATSALHLACLALGLGPGDWLWTTPVTFVASSNCALYCGAKVDFVDINPATGLMSVDSLESKLQIAEQKGELPKILVPVHLCGTSCDMASIAVLAKRYGFFVLEDASHAIGATYNSHPVGKCHYSDITVFSFHPVKIITTGEGGIATTNDADLAERMYDLRSHGIVKNTSRFLSPPNGSWAYEQQFLGFNYRITDIQAALGLSQLRCLDKIIKERHSLFNNYNNLLNNLPISFLKAPANCYSSLHLAVIRLDDQHPDHHRHIFDSLRAAGIGVQLHYGPVHLQPYYRSLGFNPGDFPEAELYGNNAISLPLYPGLTRQQQEYVCDTLTNLLL